MPISEESRWSIRASWHSQTRSSIYARNNVFTAEGKVNFREADVAPSALEYLLGALASDLIAGLKTQAMQAQTELEAAEVTLAASLSNPLIALGVIGETDGNAGIERIEGRIYVSLDCDTVTLDRIWQAVKLYSPLYQTLSRCVALNLQLKVVV